MNRFFLSVLLGIILVVVYPVHSTSIHDNYVYFKGEGFVNFHMTDYDITSGQPFDGIFTGEETDGRGFIDVRAGRKGSESVANWFRNRADVAIGDHVAEDSWPDELNFVIKGDMIICSSNGSEAKCKDILIAQGHTGAYNNWWIGGHMHKEGSTVWQECPAVDGYCGGVVTFKTVSGSSDTFDLEVRTCPVIPGKDDPDHFPRHR